MILLAVSLLAFGAVGDLKTDTAPAWSAAIRSVCASAERTLHVPVGQFLFLTPPDPVPCALNLVGEGVGVSALVRGYSGLSFLQWIGGQDPYGGGSIRDLAIDAGAFTGGYGLWVRAHAETDPTVQSHNPHGLLIDNVFFVAAATYPNSGAFAYSFYADGSDNVSPPPGVAPGLRFIRLRNVSASRFTILPYLFYYVYGARLTEVDCFIPLGGSPVVWTLHSPGTEILGSECPWTDVP